MHKLDLHAIQLGKYGGRSSYLAATLDPEVIGLPVILPASKVAVSPSNVVSLDFGVCQYLKEIYLNISYLEIIGSLILHQELTKLIQLLCNKKRT